MIAEIKARTVENSFLNGMFENAEFDKALMLIYDIGLLCRGSNLQNKWEEIISENSENPLEELEKKANKFFDQWVVGLGHTSLMEHVTYTFFIQGISRACSHQLVRHRIASYTQMSQRYSDKELAFVFPPKIKKNPNAVKIYEDIHDVIKETYSKLISTGITREDARFILSNACETELYFTINARSLLNFFQLRLWNSGPQWEIKDLARSIYDLVKAETSILTQERWNV